MKEILERYIKQHGITMVKVISQGDSGFFYYSPTTYDTRKVFSLEKVEQLSEEGFESTDDLGAIVFNALWNYRDKQSE